MEARLHVPNVLRHVGLDAALSGLQRLAEVELEMAGQWPPLYESGVGYVREPRGQERWLPPSEVLRRGQGDCEDLAAYRAAELVLTGEDELAQARVVRTGPRTWHAVVFRGDGSWEDPSAALGMVGAGGMAAPMRFALAPDGPRDYRARVDLGAGGYHERVECRAGDPCEALWDASEQASFTGLGQLPFIGPFLDIARNVAQQALQMPAPRGPAGPRGPAAPPSPWGADQPASLEDGVLDLARQLRTLARVEASRRIARAAR
jgi:hypothetical protein